MSQILLKQYFAKRNLDLKSFLNLKKKEILITNYVKNYKNLISFIFKCGNKFLLERLFFKGLLFWSKTFHTQSFQFILTEAFLNTTPYVGVKVKRKGSRNIYVTKMLNSKQSLHFSIKWMLTEALLKKKKNLYEGLIEELINSSLKTSLSVKKRNDLHKLADENARHRFSKKKKKNL